MKVLILRRHYACVCSGNWVVFFILGQASTGQSGVNINKEAQRHARPTAFPFIMSFYVRNQERFLCVVVLHYKRMQSKRLHRQNVIRMLIKQIT